MKERDPSWGHRVNTLLAGVRAYVTLCPWTESAWDEPRERFWGRGAVTSSRCVHGGRAKAERAARGSTAEAPCVEEPKACLRL